MQEIVPFVGYALFGFGEILHTLTSEYPGAIIIIKRYFIYRKGALCCVNYLLKKRDGFTSSLVCENECEPT